MINKIKLLDIDSNEPLRKYRGEEYLQIKHIPQIGSKIIYHKFNSDGGKFQGESVSYEVINVLYELQEDFNGLYDERITVLLRKIE